MELVIKNEHDKTFRDDAKRFWHLDDPEDRPFAIGDRVGWAWSDGGQDNGEYVVVDIVEGESSS